MQALRGTLCSCARVCQSWLPIARFHLFSCVSLQSVPAYDSFVRGVLHSNDMRPYLSTVRSVLLYHDIPRELPIREHAHRLFLLEFSGQLPVMDSLSLMNLDWSADIPRCSEPLLLSTFPSLTSLALVVCSLPSFSFLRRTLTAIPSLTALYIHEVTWRETEAVGPSTCTWTRPTLANFFFEYSFYMPCTDQLLLWLSQTRSQSSIYNLRFHPGRHAPLNAHVLSLTERIFLKVIAPHIKYASLTPIVNVAQCTWSNVCKLLVDATRYGTRWADLFGLLRTTPRLRILQIKINSSHVNTRNPPEACIEDHEVKELDSILGQERQKALERAEFLVIVSERDATASIFAELIRRLPTLHGRNVLAMEVEVRNVVDAPADNRGRGLEDVRSGL
ncbi:hypothetical protein OH76DRAFT_1411144 [Lentinus brumalis]|uniref:F-box domain-containing protein n=1 Tax=Lentinus brumalis TaxID=2498619 RepID=A0A371CQA3_9APHY|nr:hypothetical protein OH76DRAFT_1411144 [Polyporus brumalis]